MRAESSSSSSIVHEIIQSPLSACFPCASASVICLLEKESSSSATSTLRIPFSLPPSFIRTRTARKSQPVRRSQRSNNLLEENLRHDRRDRVPNLSALPSAQEAVLERETLQTGQLAHREIARAGRVVVVVAAAGDCVPERAVAGVARAPSAEPDHSVGAVVWEIARDTTDGVVHGVESSEMR